MAKTYRDAAIEQMVATVEEAMSRVIDWWGDLPAPMKDASLGQQLIPSNLLRGHSTEKYPKMTAPRALRDALVMPLGKQP
jgi:hypothetical protein